MSVTDQAFRALEERQKAPVVRFVSEQTPRDPLFQIMQEIRNLSSPGGARDPADLGYCMGRAYELVGDLQRKYTEFLTQLRAEQVTRDDAA